MILVFVSPATLSLNMCRMEIGRVRRPVGSIVVLGIRLTELIAWKTSMLRMFVSQL